MVALLNVRLCALLLLSSLAVAKKGGKQSKVDTSDVLNPDPNAPDADHTSEYNSGPDMVEGDMKIAGGKKGGADTRNAVADPNKLWPQGVVPYVFDISDPELGPELKNAIKQAIADYSEYTCVKYQPRQQEIDYVRFTDETDGCFSALGRIGGMQALNLGWGCEFKGVAIHEMMHAIGFEHEQKRGDRDNYVTIHFNNVKPQMKGNFDKIKTGEEDNQGFGYDYASLMHYGQFAFAKDRDYPTITTKDKKDQDKIGQRAGFSKQDVQEINRLYKCNGKTSGVEGENGCMDKEKEYCERVVRESKGRCGFSTKQYCAKSCKACGSQTGAGSGSGAGSVSKPKPGCEDKYGDYCVTRVKDQGLCGNSNLRNLCRKACDAC